MRILLYINSLAIGGAEHTVLKLAGYWAQRHDVTVLTQTPVAGDQLPVPAGVRRETTQTAGLSRHSLHALWCNLRRLIRLRAAIRRLQPDVVIGFLPTANVLALLATRGLGLPAVVAERAWPGFLGLPPVQEFVRNRLYRRARAVVVQTAAGAAWYQTRLGLDNLVVVPNGIRLPLPSRPPSIAVDTVVPATARVVLFIGRMVEPKCPDAAMAAFVQGLRDFPDWHFVLIGDGAKRDTAIGVAQAAGLAHRVHALPAAGNTGDWYRRADVFVAASRNEGFPNVLLEAMAHGVVPVAWDCATGPSEMIRDGENGFLLPVDDVSGLAGRLRQLADDPALRERLGREATGVLETFSDQQFFVAWDGIISAA